MNRATTSILIGQIVWALAQAAIVLLLPRFVSLAVIGTLMLTYAIQSPLFLLSSLNLRTLISLDVEKNIEPYGVFGFRIFCVIVVVLITSSTALFLVDDLESGLILVCLIASRAVDNVSDLAAGFFQREEQFHKIGRSFLIRGFAVFFPFTIFSVLAQNVVLGAASSMLSMALTVILLDVIPCLKLTKNRLSIIRLLISLKNVIRQSLIISPYPVLDNLHFNSFRYAMYIVVSPSFMGLIGIAQTLFSPFQLLTSAFGFKYLPTSGNIFKLKDLNKMKKHVGYGLSLGFAIPTTFVFCTILAPRWFFEIIVPLIPQESFSDIKLALFLVGISMFFMPVTGFMSLNLVAWESRKAYLVAPLVGILSFTVLFLVLSYFGTFEMSGVIVSFCFCLSAFLRAIFAIWNVKSLTFSRRKEK